MDPVNVTYYVCLYNALSQSFCSFEYMYLRLHIGRVVDYARAWHDGGMISLNVKSPKLIAAYPEIKRRRLSRSFIRFEIERYSATPRRARAAEGASS